MAVKGALQTQVRISAARPVDSDDVGNGGYGAILDADASEAWNATHFHLCGEVISIGEFGREYNVVTAVNLAEGATRKFKGSYNNGSFTMDLLFDSEGLTGNGQDGIEEAEVDIDPYSFKIVYPGAVGARETFYFHALVTTVKRVVGGPDDALMLRCTVEITHDPIKEAVT